MVFDLIKDLHTVIINYHWQNVELIKKTNYNKPKYQHGDRL